MAEFNKVGLLVQDESGRFLMCKKDRDTSLLILPGGRIEDGETDMECLDRELAEELGQVTARNVAWVGAYTAIAHNDDPDIRKTPWATGPLKTTPTPPPRGKLHRRSRRAQATPRDRPPGRLWRRP